MGNEVSGSLPAIISMRLLAAMESIATARTYEETLRRLNSAARGLLSADSAALIRQEGDVCLCVDEDAFNPLWVGRSFPIDACVSGLSITSNEKVIVHDISQDERTLNAIYQGTFVRAVSVVPLSSPGLSAIGFYWAKPHTPTDTELEMVVVLGRVASTTLSLLAENTRAALAQRDAELARDELRHRLKNTYASAIGVASLTLPKELASEYAGRVRALVSTYDAIDGPASALAPQQLSTCIANALSPYQRGPDVPISLDGPIVALKGDAIGAIGLLMNEFATNSIKYGALSSETGRIAVGWRTNDAGMVMTWAERDGPPVDVSGPPSEGSRLLRRIAERYLRGRIDCRPAIEGMEWLVEMQSGFFTSH
ncbi:hypothetical protein E0H46_19190 [Rhizobium leguminosarum bv. viciae]|nr:hypothetical protein E0H46_19190 [Rhizobium leguminosarum bv. viciae]